MPIVFAPAAALLLALMQAPAPSASPTPPCVEAPYRQFDFWIGDWEVVDQQPRGGGTPRPSKSRISRILNGCALLEEYETVGGYGYAGKSLNFYDSNDQRWHQTWIDTGGAPLYLSGGLQGRAMVMTEERKSRASGKTVTQRITWTPLEGGKVRQHWEGSTDGGQTWENVFDGVYAPRSTR